MPFLFPLKISGFQEKLTCLLPESKPSWKRDSGLILPLNLWFLLCIIRVCCWYLFSLRWCAKPSLTADEKTHIFAAMAQGPDRPPSPSAHWNALQTQHALITISDWLVTVHKGRVTIRSHLSWGHKVVWLPTVIYLLKMFAFTLLLHSEKKNSKYVCFSINRSFRSYFFFF